MRESTSHLFIIITVWSVWLLFLGLDGAWQVVVDNITITLTMLFGSFVAGSTSVGGGAVAFPVFTKLLHIDSETALLFSLAIQSIGMVAASILIFISRIPVSLHIIKHTVICGSLGMFIGLFYLRFLIAGPDIKYLFSCFSFFVAVALITYHIQSKNIRVHEYQPQTINIMIASLIGGILSGIIGTGIDFIIFTLMIFFWGFDFKVAIATSVVVMAINALSGFIMTLFAGSIFTGEVVNYWLAAIPIVVIGAPLGALACKYFHKHIILYLLLGLITIDIASTIIILGIKLQFILPLLLIFCSALLYHQTRIKV